MYIYPLWNPNTHCTLDGTESGNTKPWKCYKCWARSKIECIDSSSWQCLTLIEKAKRLGIERLDGVSDRSFMRRVTKIASNLQRILPSGVYHSIINSKPRPYPTLVPMKTSVIQNHVLQGRRFEISLLQFEVKKCSCCGCIEPSHCDLDYSTSVDIEPLPRKHLTNKWYDAYHCTCHNICKGSQYYSCSMRTQIKWYTEKHGASPWSFLGIDKNSPNAILCEKCHKEDVKKVGELLSSLFCFSYVCKY